MKKFSDGGEDWRTRLVNRNQAVRVLRAETAQRSLLMVLIKLNMIIVNCLHHSAQDSNFQDQESGWASLGQMPTLLVDKESLRTRISISSSLHTTGRKKLQKEN